MRRRFFAWITTVIVLAAGPVMAQEAGLVLTDAYLQTIIPAVPAAGYFTLQNTGDTDRVLVGASSPGCGMLMLHLSRNNSGVEEMVAVDTITVQAHRNITFAPGGYHLMCMSPGDAVTPGGTVPVTLMFEDGGTLTADFPVRSPTEN